MRITLAVIVACSLLSASVAAQVELRTIDGQNLSGRFLSLDEDGALTVATAEGARTVKSSHVVAMRFDTGPVEVPDHRSPYLRFSLAGGDEVYGEILDSTFDEIRIETKAFGILELPLDGVVSAEILANTEGMPRKYGADVATDRDVVFVRSGKGVDHVLGDVSRFSRGGVYFEWNDEGETLFNFKKDRVLAVRLAQLEPPASPKGVYARVHGTDGSRLSGYLTRSVEAGTTLKLFSGAAVKLKPSMLSEISFSNGDFVFLSDLEPKKVVETPYLEGGLTYGVRRDRGLRGDPVTISGVPFPKALEVHSRCEIRYDLGGRYDGFSTAIGLDGEVADREVRGAVAFSVELDGKVLVEPTVMRAGEKPRWLQKLDVSGGKELVLLADFADNYHFNAWAVWGGALLVRASGD